MNAGCLRMNDWHSFTTRSRYEKNNRDYFGNLLQPTILAACQANYIRDVQGGTAYHRRHC
ncbi:colicin release lysis protein (plasmid) [Escherichia coli]